MLFNKEKTHGFTLIELLVVIAIVGIISTIGLGSYRSSQAKSRDARRKSDLEDIQKALEMYQNDHGVYPLTHNFPSWGSEFKDQKNTIYMKELPKDPVENQNYFYISEDGTSYKLYAKLENTNDLCFSSNQTFCKLEGFNGTNCGTGKCNYGVSSSNTIP